MPQATVPRFFIEFDDGEYRASDTKGRFFANEEDAIETALKAFKKTVDAGAKLLQGQRYRLTVRDAGGNVIFEAGVTGKGVRAN